jgi:hypothetical protein
MQSFPILAKVLRAGHESTHLLQNCRRTATDLRPSPTESMNRRRPESRDNGCERRVIVERTAFLCGKLAVCMQRNEAG